MKNLEFVEVNDSHVGKYMSCMSYISGIIPAFEYGIIKKFKQKNPYNNDLGYVYICYPAKGGAGVYVTHVLNDTIREQYFNQIYNIDEKYKDLHPLLHEFVIIQAKLLQLDIDYTKFIVKK